MKESPSVRAKTLRLLGENIGVNLCDFRFGSRFLAMTPKTWATSTKKIGKLDLITRLWTCNKVCSENFKNFCVFKIFWLFKIFANYIFDKELVYRIYKELWQLSSIKDKWPN